MAFVIMTLAFLKHLIKSTVNVAKSGIGPGKIISIMRSFSITPNRELFWFLKGGTACNEKSSSIEMEKIRS